MEALNLPFAAEVVKNLFLRDDKKRNYYLVVMPEDKPANLKVLHTTPENRPPLFTSPPFMFANAHLAHAVFRLLSGVSAS